MIGVGVLVLGLGWLVAALLFLALVHTSRHLAATYGAICDHHAKRGHLTLADDEELWNSAGLIYASVSGITEPFAAVAAVKEAARAVYTPAGALLCPYRCPLRGVTYHRHIDRETRDGVVTHVAEWSEMELTA